MKTVDDLLNVSPLKFQEMTMSLYKALGCQVWPRRIAGRPHLYVDIVTKDNKKSLAECRIGLEDVDKEAVESFAALVKKEKAIDGAIITIVGVTDRARQTAKKRQVYLYNGNDFLSLWNNLHISDTAPRGPMPAETPAFHPEPHSEPAVETPAPEPAQELVIPASLAQVIPQTLADDVIPQTPPADVIPQTLPNDVIPQTPPEEAHESFLDQIQSEMEKDVKPARSRDEIHRLFESGPAASLPLDTYPPSAAEPPFEPAAFAQEAGAELPPEETPAGPGDQLSFFDQPEPEPDVIPTSAEFLASLEGLAQPPQEAVESAEALPEAPAGFEPMPFEADASVEEVSLPPTEAVIPQAVESLTEPAEEMPVEAIAPQPTEAPAPTVEPPLETAAPLLPQEPENVIERLFGRGIESFEPPNRLQPHEAEEKIDFSIFQVPGVKLETNGQVVVPPGETPVPAAEVPVEPVETQPPAAEEPAAVKPPLAALESPAEPVPAEEAAPTQPIPVPENLLLPIVETVPQETQVVAEAEPEAQAVAADVPAEPAEPAVPEEPEEAVAIPDFLLPMEFTTEAVPQMEAEAVKAAWEPLEAPAEPLTEAPAETLPEARAEVSPETPVSETLQAAEMVQPVDEPALSVEEPAAAAEIPLAEIPPVEMAPEPPSGPSIVVLNPADAQATRTGPDPDNLSICQALERLEGDSPCLFLTGRPGTGKAILLDYFLQSTKKNAVLLEPTAREAVEAEGQTIRSFFGFPDGLLGQADVQEADPVRKELYRHVDTLILDNISRVSPNLVDAIDAFMRLNGREAARPFGGAQLLLLGDLFLAAGPDHGVTDLQGEEYPSPFFFDAHIFQTLAMELIELKKDYDPRDEAMTALLNAIRTNALDEAQYKLLNDRYIPDFTAPEEPAYITLTSNSSVATKINKEHLRQVRSPECLHLAEIEGEFDEAAYPAARELILRKGAQVIFLKEDYARKWVKGTVGKVATISESTIQVQVDSDGFPFVFRVERETWQNFRYTFNPSSGRIEKTLVGEFTQYPLVPGWALNVQKAQGTRYDRVVIDLSGEEADAGQLYAALCCCRKLDGIVLKDRISPKYKANTGNRIQEIASLFTEQ